MKVKLITIVIFILLSTNTLIAEPINHAEEWMKTTPRERVSFVAGMSHGLSLMYSDLYIKLFPYIPDGYEDFTIDIDILRTNPDNTPVFSPKFTLDIREVALAMTSIYSDPQNGCVGLNYVFALACDMVKGFDVTERLERTRKVFGRLKKEQ